MENIFCKLSERLISFFTRSVAPSSFFFILLFFIDCFFNNEKIFDEVFIILDEINQLNSILLYVVLVVVFLAYGYINQIFSQFLDEFFKGDYKTCNLDFKNLRKEVCKRIEKKEVFKHIEKTDYNFYQVLGKNLNTKNYVDEIKAIHTIVVATFFNISILLLLEVDINVKFIFIFILMIVFYIGNLSAGKRYMARNKRLYINFIESKGKNKIEPKVKYVKDIR